MLRVFSILQSKKLSQHITVHSDVIATDVDRHSTYNIDGQSSKLPGWPEENGKPNMPVLNAPLLAGLV